MILGVKQPDVSRLLPGKTYLFFAHVIKGQQENRALLDKILELGIRLFDYECIREAGAKGSPRLVAFGKFAGYAGMINTFQALGQKLLAHGYSTPFLNISSAYMYRDLDAAEQAVAAVGRDIAAGALDRLGFPLVFTFTGNGNVSRGAQVRRRSLALALSSLLAAPLRVPSAAQEIFQLLPHCMVQPRDLPAARARAGPHRVVYGCVARDDSMVRRRGAAAAAGFDVEHYRAEPHLYDAVFHETIAPHTTVTAD